MMATSDGLPGGRLVALSCFVSGVLLLLLLSMDGDLEYKKAKITTELESSEVLSPKLC